MVEPTEQGRDLEAAAARAQARVACDTGLPPLELADLRRRLRDLAAQLAPDLRSVPQPAGRTSTPEGAAS